MKFQETFCSQCGGKFGPGDSGFSHCDQHDGQTNVDEVYPHQPGSPLFDGAEAFDAYGKEQDKDLVAARDLVVAVPQELHPYTKRLVQSFAEQLAEKLRAAEIKYGHTDGWLKDDWEYACRQQFAAHMAKGDPRDVAIYCAFMWARGWSTNPPRRLRRPASRTRGTENPDAVIGEKRGG